MADLHPVFQYEALIILGRAYAANYILPSVDSRFERRFMSYFGVSLAMAVVIWKTLDEGGFLQKFRRPQPKHLLWALMFLKVYAKETVHARMADCHENTLRAWVWKFVEAISELDVVSIRENLTSYQ
eukprot:Pompholyxophrys_punicea_v1_NODE_1692_length_590_cov_1.358879.p1 type:complete len:127 gc:universal NODE_1692_length_590_cov_1.358879:147-527(+)